MLQSETAVSVRARIERETGPLPVAKLAYWLCGTPRTGSNLLRFSLDKANCGHPAEGYHKYANRDLGWGYDEKDFIRYNRQMIQNQTSPETGIFGLKIFWEQFQYYLDQCEQAPITGGQRLTPYEKVAVFYPEVKFIFIRRRDKLRQAISLVKAKQSNLYIVPKNRRSAQTQPVRFRYNSRMISYYLGLFAAHDTHWENFFKLGGITPYTVWYEDLIAKYNRSVKEIIRFIGFEAERVRRSPFVKQSDEVNELWYQRYRKENPWLEDPEDVVNILANDHLRKLRRADGETSVSIGIWWMRLRRLIADPAAYLKRLRMK
jgi:LPS sulfotransferase NodH